MCVHSFFDGNRKQETGNRKPNNAGVSFLLTFLQFLGKECFVYRWTFLCTGGLLIRFLSLFLVMTILIQSWVCSEAHRQSSKSVREVHNAEQHVINQSRVCSEAHKQNSCRSRLSKIFDHGTLDHKYLNERNVCFLVLVWKFRFKEIKKAIENYAWDMRPWIHRAAWPKGLGSSRV